ncbi:MAG: hypothetical protein LBR23_02695 [Spirochaetaceae bacterium]|jgi:WD40 repeat protein|nr:hypothetical protein [Spirochaetaceae bacterium]
MKNRKFWAAVALLVASVVLAGYNKDTSSGGPSAASAQTVKEPQKSGSSDGKGNPFLGTWVLFEHGFPHEVVVFGADTAVWEYSDPTEQPVTYKNGKAYTLYPGGPGLTFTVKNAAELICIDDWSTYPDEEVYTRGTKQKLVLEGTALRCTAFSPDGKHIAATSGEGIHIWNADKGTLIRTLGYKTDSSIAFNPDGKCIATTFGEGIHIWDADRGTLIRTLAGKHVYSIAFSPDGKCIAATSEEGVHIWDTDKGTLIRTLAESESGNCIAFSPDGKRIAYDAYDEHQFLVLRDADTGALLWRRNFYDPFNSLAFSPDGKRIGIGMSSRYSYSGHVSVLDAGTGVIISTLEGFLYGSVYVAFSPDGKRIVCADKMCVKLLDADTGVLIKMLVWTGWQGDSDPYFSPFKSLAFNPDGKHIMCMGSMTDRDVVLVWDVEE